MDLKAPASPPRKFWDTKTPKLPGHVFGFFLGGAMSPPAIFGFLTKKMVDFAIDALDVIDFFRFL